MKKEWESPLKPKGTMRVLSHKKSLTAIAPIPSIIDLGGIDSTVTVDRLFDNVVAQLDKLLTFLQDFAIYIMPVVIIVFILIYALSSDERKTARYRAKIISAFIAVTVIINIKFIISLVMNIGAAIFN